MGSTLNSSVQASCHADKWEPTPLVRGQNVAGADPREPAANVKSAAACGHGAAIGRRSGYGLRTTGYGQPGARTAEPEPGTQNLEPAPRARQPVQTAHTAVLSISKIVSTERVELPAPNREGAAEWLVAFV
jgi:hypothetical protein